MSEAEDHEFEFFHSFFEQNIGVGLPSDGSFGISSSIDILRRQRRPTSMKISVAPQLTRAVVSMICVPLDSLMEICMVLSFGRAVITWFAIWEEYVDSSS